MSEEKHKNGILESIKFDYRRKDFRKYLNFLKKKYRN